MNLSEFNQLLDQSGTPLLVDFWAPWCLPCRRTKPILKSLANEYAGEVDFLEIDADASPEIVQHFKVTGIPTLLSFQDGEIKSRIKGPQDKASYNAIFNSLAEGKSPPIVISAFDRALLMGAGLLLGIIALSFSNWYLLVFSSLIILRGVYDIFPLLSESNKSSRNTH